jgi:hypothetical protein
MSTQRPKIEIGDCFVIPLPDGRFGYCQHVYHHQEFGYLVRVFDKITSEPLNTTAELVTAGLLFPPVFVGLRASVRSGRWKRIGSMVVKDFAFPKFRITMGTKPGTYQDWRIWDGTTTRTIGELPISLRSLELQSVWGDEALEERISSGTYRGQQMF